MLFRWIVAALLLQVVWGWVQPEAIERGPERLLYCKRWHLLGPLVSWVSTITGLCPNLYLQHFVDSDRPIPHNHPRWFFTLILSGGYQESRVLTRTPHSTFGRVRLFLPGCSNWIARGTYHWVELVDKTKGCWTLALVGPTFKRRWGFLVDGKHVDSRVWKGQP